MNEPTGCPVCESEDYEVSDYDETGLPDYDSEKTCQECGEVWT